MQQNTLTLRQRLTKVCYLLASVFYTTILFATI